MDTPLLQRLKAYLADTPYEQKVKDWADIKALGLTGGPTAQELIASFRHTPAFHQVPLFFASKTSAAQPEFVMEEGVAQMGMAA